METNTLKDTETAPLENQGTNIIRTANPMRRRNALGRGLQALLSPTAVSVDFANTFSSSKKIDESLQNNSNKPNFQQEFGSLIPISSNEKNNSSEVKLSPEPEENSIGGLAYLPIDQIKPNPNQPRQYFPKEEIENLANSIKESGLLQPIIVRCSPNETDHAVTYEIVAGERRWRAAAEAGLSRVPVLLRQLSDKEVLEFGIIENVQRSDLNVIEEAEAYHKLISNFGATQESIAQTIGKDRASIANALRLLKLSPQIQQMLINKELTAGHAKILLSVSDVAEQLKLANRIKQDSLSVRAVELILQQNKQQLAQTEDNLEPTASQVKLTSSKSIQIQELEERFRRSLGTKVSLKMNKHGKGELKISFYSEAELDNLIDRLG